MDKFNVPDDVLKIAEDIESEIQEILGAVAIKYRNKGEDVTKFDSALQIAIGRIFSIITISNCFAARASKKELLTEIIEPSFNQIIKALASLPD